MGQHRKITPFEALRQNKLFANVEDGVIQQIIPQLRFRKYEKREFVMHRNTAGDLLCLLIAGRLQVVANTPDGKEVGLQYIDPNDFFGELSIIDGEVRSASVQATADSIVGFIPKDIAQQLFFKHPQVIQTVMKRLCTTVRHSSQQLSNLAMPRSTTRIFAILHNTAKTQPGNLITIENLPNQQSLATMANVSRESVSRAIHALIKSGVLEKDFRRLIVRSPEVLDRLAKGELELEQVGQHKASSTESTPTASHVRTAPRPNHSYDEDDQ